MSGIWTGSIVERLRDWQEDLEGKKVIPHEGNSLSKSTEVRERMLLQELASAKTWEMEWK